MFSDIFVGGTSQCGPHTFLNHLNMNSPIFRISSNHWLLSFVTSWNLRSLKCLTLYQFRSFQDAKPLIKQSFQKQQACRLRKILKVRKNLLFERQSVKFTFFCVHCFPSLWLFWHCKNKFNLTASGKKLLIPQNSWSPQSFGSLKLIAPCKYGPFKSWTYWKCWNPANLDYILLLV